jgi:hypothetical protein
MEKGAMKDLTYGGLMELINNSKYFYKSSVGKDYSHLTDAGKEAVQQFVDMMAWKMIEAENANLDARAKAQVLDALKQK